MLRLISEVPTPLEKLQSPLHFKGMSWQQQLALAATAPSPLPLPKLHPTIFPLFSVSTELKPSTLELLCPRGSRDPARGSGSRPHQPTHPAAAGQPSCRLKGPENTQWGVPTAPQSCQTAHSRADLCPGWLQSSWPARPIPFIHQKLFLGDLSFPPATTGAKMSLRHGTSLQTAR